MNVKTNRGLSFQDLRIAVGFCVFMLFVICIILGNTSIKEINRNQKLNTKISMLTADNQVLRARMKVDIIDREGHLTYNQVSGHLKSLGL